MTEYINHRINDLTLLNTLSKTDGAEIDIRYHDSELILSHDPFHGKSAHTLDAYLQKWASLQIKGTLILNLKSEGIELKCIELLSQYSITNWFFLDLSMPYLVKYSLVAQSLSLPNFSPQNLATRFSEHEPIEYALSFENKATWVWVDCFTHLPLNKITYGALKKRQFKICLVSPELQGHGLDKITLFKKIILENNFLIDAICTKRVDLWK